MSHPVDLAGTELTVMLWWTKHLVGSPQEQNPHKEYKLQGNV